MVTAVFKIGDFWGVTDSLCTFLQQSHSNAFMLFSLVRLPIPHMRCSLPALRRMSTPLHLPESFQASGFSFPWGFMLSHAASECITYTFAFPFWGESAKRVPVRSRPVLHVCVRLCRSAEAYLCAPRPCSEQPVPELARQGATQTPPNHIQTRGTVASQLLRSVPWSF